MRTDPFHYWKEREEGEVVIKLKLLEYLLYLLPDIEPVPESLWSDCEALTTVA